jgi:hypothetical protein
MKVQAATDRSRSLVLDSIDRASTIVADRLCSAVANPIVRNAQEQRQLALIGGYLDERGYRKQAHPPGRPLTEMEPGTYSFRMNLPVGKSRRVNIPIDVVIQPRKLRSDATSSSDASSGRKWPDGSGQPWTLSAQRRHTDSGPHPRHPQLREGEFSRHLRRLRPHSDLRPEGLAARARLLDLPAAGFR